MDKEKEIQEMAINWCALREYGSCSCLADGEPCSTLGVCSGIERARELYTAGYRKQTEVAAEIIQEILDNSRPTFDKDGKPIIEINADLTANLCKKYGVNYG